MNALIEIKNDTAPYPSRNNTAGQASYDNGGGNIVRLPEPPLVEGSEISSEMFADMVLQEMIPVLSFKHEQTRYGDFHKLRLNIKCDEREEDVLRLNGREIYIEEIMTADWGKQKYGDDYEKILGVMMKGLAKKLMKGELKQLIINS